MSKYAKPALDELARTIREAEQRAAEAAEQRDVLLAKAHNVAIEQSDALATAANLREILAGADSKYYAAAFGEPFVEDADPARDELIAHWRGMLAFLEATPEVPFTDHGIFINDDRLRDATDPERRAEAERLAGLLGVEIRNYTDYANRQVLIVERPFGAVSLTAHITLAAKPEPAAAAEGAAAEAQPPEGLAPCGTCGGTGGDAGTGDEDDRGCEECGGTGLVSTGRCGAKAVNPAGETGSCTLDAGHDDPDSPAYDCRQANGHFDPAFGFWSTAGDRAFYGRGPHAESLNHPGRCANCGLSTSDGYCFGPSHDAAATSAGAR